MTRRIPLPRRPTVAHWRAAFSVVCLLPLLHSAGGQEVPRPSVARQKAKTSLPSAANFRIGEVAMQVTGTMTMDFVDNVNLSPDAEADLIITPQVGISAAWAVTKMNTLRFRASAGYSYYVNSPELNREIILISPDSALNFDIYSGDFRINFHEQFSLQQDPVDQGGAAGVARLARFSNTAGVTVLWDTNDVIWSLGYDHFNFLTLGGPTSSDGTSLNSLSRLDHSTDNTSVSASFKISSAMIAGIEGTASFSDYPEQSEANFGSLSVGTFFELQLTRYTHIFASGGYNYYLAGDTVPGTFSIDETAPVQPAQGNPSGYYWTLSFLHKLNRYYSDRLDLGRSDEISALNGYTRANFARYAANWRVSDKLTLSAGLFIEDVQLVSGSALGGTVQGDYWRFGANLNTGYALTEKMSLGLAYQFAKRQSVRENESYTQNRVTISVGYRF